jgi:hypothetical protein
VKVNIVVIGLWLCAIVYMLRKQKYTGDFTFFLFVFFAGMSTMKRKSLMTSDTESKEVVLGGHVNMY